MKTKIILIIAAIIIIGGGIFIYFKCFSPEEHPVEPEIIETIEEFGYTLSNNDPDIFKIEFENLRAIVNQDEINYEAYAISLSKLFIIDFYNLNSKINKYDVGGLEFVHSAIKDNFEVKAMDTIYKFIEDNTDNKRVQKLPEIKEVQLVDISIEQEYLIDKNKVPAIVVNLEWDYMEKSTYDARATITFIRNDRKLVLVDLKTK